MLTKYWAPILLLLWMVPAWKSNCTFYSAVLKLSSPKVQCSSKLWLYLVSGKLADVTKGMCAFWPNFLLEPELPFLWPCQPLCRCGKNRDWLLPCAEAAALRARSTSWRSKEQGLIPGGQRGGTDWPGGCHENLVFLLIHFSPYTIPTDPRTKKIRGK